MKKSSLEFEDIIGRYFNLKVKKYNYRIYVEEAGKGTPLLCLHTAGSDGRQFRHILNDKKIGGILCESKNINNGKTVVIGLGMNVNEKADDFPENLRKSAISLSMVSNKTFQRERVLAKILNHFEKNLDLLDRKNLELFKIWESFCNHINKKVTFHYNNVNVVGRFINISDEGNAIIEINNRQEAFSSGIVEINNTI